MKILFFADASSVHTERWAAWYRDKGCRVEIISFSPGRIRGVRVHYLNVGDISPYRTNLNYLRALPAVALTCMKIRADVTVAHYITSYGFMASLFCRRFFMVVMGTDIKVTPRKNRALRLLTRFVLWRARGIFAAAAHMRDDLRALGAADKKVVTLQYGIDGGLFYDDRQQGRDSRCISTRALKKNSNIDLVIRAFAAAAETREDLSLLIAGDGPERQHLEHLAASLPVRDRITFAGALSARQVAAELKRSALFISLTSSDGAPLSLMEAMYAGALPVVSDIPASREWVTEGKTGFLAAVDDRALAAAIGRALALSPAERARMTAGARKNVAEKGLYEINMRKMELIMLADTRYGTAHE